MNTNEWIAYIDRLRAQGAGLAPAERLRGELLAAGAWHGYTENEPNPGPMRGVYYLVRWEQPTVAVSHDDPTEALKLACTIERAALWRYQPKAAREAIWAVDLDSALDDKR